MTHNSNYLLYSYSMCTQIIPVSPLHIAHAAHFRLQKLIIEMDLNVQAKILELFILTSNQTVQLLFANQSMSLQY